jgi:hypothetical protein
MIIFVQKQSAPEVSQSVCLSLPATTSAVSTRHTHVCHLKPCITVHKHPNVILITCHECRCSQRLLLPKWGYIRRYCANRPRRSVHGGCALRTVTFQQLYESTVSFCVLSSIELTLHCSTTLGGTNWKRFKPFYNFPKQKRKSNRDVYLTKKYYAHKNKGLW